MKLTDQFRDTDLSGRLIKRIAQISKKRIRLMEFCGGHTVTIFKYGIRQLLPKTVEMLSGPGCPVCVTPNEDLDRAIAISRLPGVIIATFGDLLKVPSSNSSLQQVRAEGSDIRVVYSTLEALNIARDNPLQPVVFIGIGFETTAPTVAASIQQAAQEGLTNYHVLSLHKLTPPVIRSLLDSGEIKIDGIVCPGHVSTIIGSKPFQFIPTNYGIACAISGFEPLDIILCISMLVEQIERKKPTVDIPYSRAVRPYGNRQALELINQTFEICTARWRGVGDVPDSGLRIKPEYHNFNAEQVFEIPQIQPYEPNNCLCGDILRGIKTPLDCKLFKTSCTPEHPIGPCMVSSEGSCAANYHYGEEHG